MEIIRDGKAYELTKSELRDAYEEQKRLLHFQSVKNGMTQYLNKDEYARLSSRNETVTYAVNLLREYENNKLPHEQAVKRAVEEMRDFYMDPELDNMFRQNTKINYLYRDACNYKQPNEVVISGTFTEEQIDTIINCLVMDGPNEGFFIPSQIGFPETRFNEITEDDHCWFELCKESFMQTNESPTIELTPSEVVEQFVAAKDNWKETDTLMEMELD